MNARTAIRIPEDVLRVLDAATIEGNRLVLVGQLDRKLYEQTNRVLDAAGGKWNRGAKAHVFDGPAIEAIEPLILTGEYSRTKQDFGQFDTPLALADDLVERAGVLAGMLCLEPSAGIGRIADALAAAGGIVTAFEIDAKRANELGDYVVHLFDFLQADPVPEYDRVVMNPPFAGQVDIDHVRHAFKFLKPGGRLVSIMSAGVIFRDNRKTADFRAFIERAGGSIERLDEGAFRESGTMVNTCIVSAFS